MYLQFYLWMVLLPLKCDFFKVDTESFPLLDLNEVIDMNKEEWARGSDLTQ